MCARSFAGGERGAGDGAGRPGREAEGGDPEPERAPGREGHPDLALRHPRPAAEGNPGRGERSAVAVTIQRRRS